MRNYYPYPNYPLQSGYAPSRHQGISSQVMSKDTGWVFFPSPRQYQGPIRSYSSGGPPNTTYYNYIYSYEGYAVYGFNAEMNGRVAPLHKSGWVTNGTGSAQWGSTQYMEVSRDGSKLTYLYQPYYYYEYLHQERMRMANNIDFGSSTGSIQGFNASVDAHQLQGGNGRGGEAFTYPKGNTSDIWYTYKAGAGNETNKEIVRARLLPNNTWDFKRYNTLPGRMNVLHGGR